MYMYMYIYINTYIHGPPRPGSCRAPPATGVNNLQS